MPEDTGLGWSLSSDFQIVREIRGHDDFRQLSGYYYYEQVPFGKLTNFDFANTYTPPPIIVYECLIMRLILNLINIIID